MPLGCLFAELYLSPIAGVAELADALDLGSSIRKDVGVRVSSPALLLFIHLEK